MQRIQRAIAIVLFMGAVTSGSTGCASMGSACGAILNIAMGLGVAVGSYYLAKELSK